MNTDYIHWDDSDMDLEDLLGEFTEHDDDRVRDDTSSDDQNARLAGEENIRPVQTYICPVCKKIYKTIRGFRGYVNITHNMPDLKAHENRTNKEQCIDTDKSEKGDGSPLRIFEFFQTILIESILLTLTQITSSRVLSEKRRNINLIGVKISESCEAKTKIQEFLENPLFSIFSKLGVGLSMGSDREHMCKSFHVLRLDDKFCSDFSRLIIFANADLHTRHSFIQSFLQKLVTVLLQTTNRSIEKSSEVEPTDISFSDQSVLFYIAGFIVHALNNKKIVCEKFVSATGEKYIRKFQSWSDRINRGGLKIPSDNFYLLIRNMECEMRKHVNLEKLSSTTLLCLKLKEILMTNFMVKFYWEKFNYEESERKGMYVLKTIIDIFLKVRGNATTKFIKRCIQKEKVLLKHTKNSTSLRKSLKK
ncbi:hypothetical protein SNE40_001626 [Patella caerulea]|uniref:Uncharacterized protein n=1 Tax=Patella caerulea TaxID=87958 RepID=A0AAN8Q3R6_PATCE